jgi:N-acetyl-gamma-glutamyl-phosphate reductase
MKDPKRVAVIGATGYAGFELARLLLRHSEVKRPTFYLRGESAQARCLTQIFPQLRGWGEAPCRLLSIDAIAASGERTAFLATPPEVSLELAPQLLSAGLRVIDLSGAFRLRDPQTFERWYKRPGPDKDLAECATYGLPELYSANLPEAELVANPGCYATSVILGLRPLMEAGWVDASRGIVCDCKSGASGAGKEPKQETSFVEVNENFRAYGVFSHRHTPEITEHTGIDSSDLIFTTHLLPLERGILSTISFWLTEARKAEEIEALFRKFYATRPMVRIWPAGKLPELQHVTRTNFCDVGFALDESRKRMVVVSCLDNLGKGAAGQAVQNFNWMHGHAEETGLI